MLECIHTCVVTQRHLPKVQHGINKTEKHRILSVTGSLICFGSLKSLISPLNIDTGFLGFFSRLIITLTIMNMSFFCAKTESDEPRILKGGFQPIKTCDVYICYLRSNPILCTRLSKILQAYTSK